MRDDRVAGVTGGGGVHRRRRDPGVDRVDPGGSARDRVGRRVHLPRGQRRAHAAVSDARAPLTAGPDARVVPTGRAGAVLAARRRGRSVRSAPARHRVDRAGPGVRRGVDDVAPAALAPRTDADARGGRDDRPGPAHDRAARAVRGTAHQPDGRSHLRAPAPPSASPIRGVLSVTWRSKERCRASLWSMVTHRNPRSEHRSGLLDHPGVHALSRMWPNCKNCAKKCLQEAASAPTVDPGPPTRIFPPAERNGM